MKRARVLPAAFLAAAAGAVAAAGAGVVASGCGQDTRPPVWAYISPVIFQPNCATTSCHSNAASVAGLDFSNPDRGYYSLTQLSVGIVDPSAVNDPNCTNIDGVIVCEGQQRALVTPHDPARSRLVNVLRARGLPRMPPDRPLPEVDIRLVEQWILRGASRDDRPEGDDAGIININVPDGGDGGAEVDVDADVD